MNFANLTGLTIPEGNVTQITDASGRAIWSAVVPVVLQVEKITSNTYAGETTYTGEQFILLDIYPKTNGTVKVTYGGLTKTITDTSGAEEPNAQQVFFGTFNGVSDSVETPASGELTIEGDYCAFGCGGYARTSKNTTYCCNCVIGVKDFGKVKYIPDCAFASLMGDDDSCTKITQITLPTTVTYIGTFSFEDCTGLTSINIPPNVVTIEVSAFQACTGLTSVIFENPYNWFVTTVTDTTPIAVDVTDPAANAKLISETYQDYIWSRST